MPSTIIHIHDRKFKAFISERLIKRAVKKMGQAISRDFHGEPVVFLAILNGSFMFAADLLRTIRLPGPEITFLRISSYEGTASSGVAKKVIGIDRELQGKKVIILEDIIDTGLTIEVIQGQLEELGCSQVSVATLLLKPAAYRGTRKIDYVGFEIPNDFVIGYGLDYDGIGRNLNELYHEIS
jgi:hypoxanthine phosphoribosyltransferase